MKRFAAVTGPTPQFVQWAIEKECPLRELDVSRLPATTFQQLRSLRAVGEGIAEGRIVEGVCFQPELVPGQPIETVRGFRVDEVLDLVGGESVVRDACGRCPANATFPVWGPWPGCFGFLPADPDWTPRRDGEETRIDEARVAWFDAALNEGTGKTGESNAGWRNWYHLWQTGIFEGQDLIRLGEVLDGALRREKEARQGKASSLESRAVEWLRWGVTACREYGLRLHCQLHPPGVSDGIEWTLAACCPGCQAPRDDNRGLCPGCASPSPPVPPRKRKVLGDRPFLFLADVLGSEQVSVLVDTFWQHRSH